MIGKKFLHASLLLRFLLQGIQVLE